jgi:FK506-binding nuclear protein
MFVNVWNSRFEEIEDEAEPVKAQKRPRESDATEITAKAEKKNKKQKAEGGKAVESPADAATPKEEKKEKKKKEKKVDEAKEEKKETHAKKTIAGGVTIQDAKIGTGPMAKKGNTVRMRYVGKLTNGKEFDKNVSGKPVCFLT